MGNISKAKREKMIAYIEQLKQQHSDDESIIAFNEIENALTEKKFGLVWEEHEEEVDEKLKENIPVFIEDNERRIISDCCLPWNFIIEGDNLQALYLLEKTHSKKIDCIYIDPPYNTGARDWKYNNDYVDKNDTYRHSKWLSMMSARLKIASKLLRDDGVLICAIDENELGTLLLLLDDIFGQAYTMDPITIIHNPRGIQGDNFSYVNEFAVFVYKKGLKVIEDMPVEEDDIDWSPLRNWGDESERLDAANCFYPIIVKKDTIVGFGDDVTSDDSIHPRQTEYNEKDDTYSIWPIDVQGIERKWRYARQSVESIAHLLRVKKTKTGFDIELGKNFAPYRTVWVDKKYDANEYGSQLIKAMVPSNDFDFPKSVYNTLECLRAVTLYRPNATILDFFAGSGTTGHATLMLNKELGGERRFILCTNNDVGEKKEKKYKSEHGKIEKQSAEWKQYCEKYGIASSVTYPRVKAAILGFTHKKDYKEILFQLKITPKLLSKSQKTLSDIEKIEKDNDKKYDEIKSVVENDVLKVLGITKKAHHIEGISANLKYLKSDWTPRYPEEDSLSDALCLHIKEMIELQNAIEVDNKKYVLLLNKKAVTDFINDSERFTGAEKVWVNQKIIMNGEELKKLKEKRFSYIPHEFFGMELREVSE